MRLLLVIGSDGTGGIVPHIGEITKYMAGYKITILCSDEFKEGLEKKFRIRNAEYILVKAKKPYYFTTNLSFLKKIRSYDTIHIHSYTNFLSDIIIATKMLHKKRIVLTLHGSLHQYTNKKLKLLKKVHNIFMRLFNKNITAVMCVSNGEKEIVKNYFGKEKTKSLYVGVNKKYFKIKREKNKDKTILYIGRLAASKNIELLIEMMQYLTDFKMIIAGPDDNTKEKLLLMIKELKLNNIKILGEIDEITKDKLLATASVFVHPSKQDIFALSLIEATAAGIPGVCFDKEGLNEMIKDGVTGILARGETARDLADAVREAMKIKNESMIKRYVRNKFSWKKTAERYMMEYENRNNN